VERQKAVLCRNRLGFVNASQHRSGAEIESRKRSIYAWPGQNRAGGLVNPGRGEEEGWWMLSRSGFSGSAREGGGCSRDERGSVLLGRRGFCSEEKREGWVAQSRHSGEDSR